MVPLSILTLNAGLFRIRIFGLPVSDPIPHVAERSRRLAPELLSLAPDVIALQEVFEDIHIQALVRMLGSAYPHVATGMRGRGGRHGLVTLSRYPIIAEELIPFRAAAMSERVFFPKRILRTRLRTPAGPMDLHNIHLAAGLAPESPRIQRIRARQIAELFATFSDTDRVPQVLAGDFNTGPESSPSNHAMFEAHGYLDVFAASGSHEGRPTVTWDPQNPLNKNGPHRHCPPQRCDHIFLWTPDGTPRSHIIDAGLVFQTPCVAITDGVMTTLSDHYGLRAVLVL